MSPITNFFHESVTMKLNRIEMLHLGPEHFLAAWSQSCNIQRPRKLTLLVVTLRLLTGEYRQNAAIVFDDTLEAPPCVLCRWFVGSRRQP